MVVVTYDNIRMMISYSLDRPQALPSLDARLNICPLNPWAIYSNWWLSGRCNCSGVYRVMCRTARERSLVSKLSPSCVHRGSKVIYSLVHARILRRAWEGEAKIATYTIVTCVLTINSSSSLFFSLDWDENKQVLLNLYCMCTSNSLGSCPLYFDA